MISPPKAGCGFKISWLPLAQLHLTYLRIYGMIQLRKVGVSMKETMKKRFFTPIWKCDEIESELERLEKDGWRLDKISGFRKFVFVKASPRSATYFFTCSFVKESGMINTEYILKSRYKADRIPGSFLEGLKTTTVYRTTGEVDLQQRKLYRNRYLSHLVLQYIGLGLLFLVPSVTGIILSCTLNGTPVWNAGHLILLFVGICGAAMSLHHLAGSIYLRKQYRNYVRTEPE